MLKINQEAGAPERSRTSTTLRSHAPEACLSANSSTGAYLIFADLYFFTRLVLIYHLAILKKRSVSRAPIIFSIPFTLVET